MSYIVLNHLLRTTASMCKCYSFSSIAPGDFTNLSTTLYFDAFKNSSVVNVEIVDDGIVEYDKTFVVSLTMEDDQERIDILDPNTTVYIANDDRRFYILSVIFLLHY